MLTEDEERDRAKRRVQEDAPPTREEQISEIVDAVKASKYPLSDFIEDSWEIADRVFGIMMDKEDDKQGRIGDLYDWYINRFAVWVVDMPNNYYVGIDKEKLGLS
jgi:hypothetical protein